MTISKWSTPEHGSSSLWLMTAQGPKAIVTITAPLPHAEGMLARWLLTVTSWGVHMHFDLPDGDGDMWARAWEIGLVELAQEMEERSGSIRSMIHDVVRERAAKRWAGGAE